MSFDKRYLKMAEQIRQTKSEGDEVTMCMLLDMAEEKGIGQGINRVNLLNIRLAEEGRTEDILIAAKDLDLQHKPMELYGI